MPPFSLPKAHLLRSNKEFQRVYRHGRRLHDKGIAYIVLANSEERSRLGISVPKKTGSAVRRNRIKRLVREAFRLNRHLFPESCDIVITIRPGFSLDSLHDLVSSIERTFGKLTKQRQGL